MLRWAIIAVGLVAFTTVACAPPTLEGGSGADESASTGSAKKSTAKKKGTTTTAGDDDDTTGDDDTTAAAPAKKTTTTATAAAPASFAAVYSGLNNCAGCHLGGSGGAPIFFGADAAKTYPLFKAQGYQSAESVLMTKGAHAGPSLTASQSDAVTAWITDEAK